MFAMYLAAGMLLVDLSASSQRDNRDLRQRLKSALSSSEEYESASRALERKDFRTIEAMLERRTFSGASDSAELLSLEGSLAFLAGDMGLARSRFETAATFSPLDTGDSFTLAMALVKLGDDEQAAHLLSQLRAKHPDSSIYLYWLGRIDYDQRRYQEAIAKLQQVVEVAPTSARAWNSLALALDMSGHVDRAYTAFTNAANLNRGSAHPSAWPPHDLGSFCLRTDRLAEARTALEESIRYDPTLAEAHYHLARTLERQADAEQAISEYKIAVSADRLSPDACYSLAMLYRRLHRNQAAAEMFEEYRKRKAAQPVPSLSKKL